MQSVIKYLISKYLLMQYDYSRPVCIGQISDDFTQRLIYTSIDFQEVACA